MVTITTAASDAYSSLFGSLFFFARMWFHWSRRKGGAASTARSTLSGVSGILSGQSLTGGRPHWRVGGLVSGFRIFDLRGQECPGPLDLRMCGLLILHAHDNRQTDALKKSATLRHRNDDVLYVIDLQMIHDGPVYVGLQLMLPKRRQQILIEVAP